MTDEPTTTLRATVNGRPVESEVPVRLSLADWLRDHLGLTGTHLGCEHGVCGCCNVLLDGVDVRACLLLAVQVDGHEVVTVEGLEGPDGELNRVQQAFCETHALQCGFCTPGMVVAGSRLLADDPRPDDATIEEALGGTICRCTGYQQIREAMERAAGMADAQESA